MLFLVVSCTNPLKEYLAQKRGSALAVSHSVVDGKFEKLFSRYDALRESLANDRFSNLPKHLALISQEAEILSKRFSFSPKYLCLCPQFAGGQFLSTRQ